MTPKEALENANLKGSKSYEVLLKALNELEELKRDVKRYFELDERYFALQGDGFQPECNELYKLKVKLSKVGNEE